MKKIFIALLLVPMVNANEDIDIEFNMNCKVTGQTLIQSVDGVATKYGFFTNGLKDGDSFSITFKLKEGFKGYYTLDIDSDDLNIFSYFSNEDANNSLGNMIQYKELSDSLYITDNHMNYSSVFTNTTMRRYYKNDWHLMSTNKASVGNTHRTLTANCLNMPSGFDDMIEAIKKLDGDKWKGGFNPAEKDTDK